MSLQTTEVTRRVCDYLDYSGSLSLNPLVSQISVQHSVERETWYITLWHADSGHAFTASFVDKDTFDQGIAACVQDAMRRIEIRFRDYHDQLIDRRLAARKKVGFR